MTEKTKSKIKSLVFVIVFTSFILLFQNAIFLLFNKITRLVLEKNFQFVLERYYWNFYLLSSLLSLFILLKIINKSNKNDKDFVFNEKINYPKVIYGLKNLLIFIIITTLYIYIVEKISKTNDFLSDALKNYGQIENLIGKKFNIFTLMSVALVGPIFEEILFRAFMIGKLKRDFSINTAIIIQAIFFGLVHGNLIQGIYAFIAAIIFAKVYIKTRSIKIAIFMHIINNFVSSLSLIEKFLPYISFFLIFIIILVLLDVFSKKKSENQEK